MSTASIGSLFLGEREDAPEAQARRTRAISHALGGLMSFSVTFKGTPEEIKAKLTETSATLTEQSKAEFDAVKPALETLLDQHQGDGLVYLSANGHASFKDGQRTYSTGQVTILGNQAAD